LQQDRPADSGQLRALAREPRPERGDRMVRLGIEASGALHHGPRKQDLAAGEGSERPIRWDGIDPFSRWGRESIEAERRGVEDDAQADDQIRPAENALKAQGREGAGRQEVTRPQH
jgi:hypothetical protein